MKSTNTGQPNNVIKQLDDLLYQGLLLKRNTCDGYDEISKKTGFDVNAYEKEFEGAINKWLNEAAKILFTKLSEKHYYYHLLEPDKLLPIKMPHPLGHLIVAFDGHLHALEEIILRLEENRNLAVRQEIAEKEYQADILYKVTYSEHTREIKLNNMILARLKFDSKSVNFFEYVYAHPNKPLSTKDIEEDTAFSLSANIHDILRDLGFKGNIRKVFFPIATKTKVMFMNPISKQYAIKNDLPIIAMSKDNETEREVTT
jgi:hypothetical protein